MLPSYLVDSTHSKIGASNLRPRNIFEAQFGPNWPNWPNWSQNSKFVGILQGRKTKFAFPLYTVETGTKFRSRFHCIQGKRKFRFSSLVFWRIFLSFRQKMAQIMWKKLYLGPETNLGWRLCSKISKSPKHLMIFRWPNSIFTH